MPSLPRLLPGLLPACLLASAFAGTEVTIHGEDFRIHGKPTDEGRIRNRHRVGGLLMNSRMVQGIFDYRRKGEGPDEGYQSPPVNRGIRSVRKRAFFKLLAEITGHPDP